MRDFIERAVLLDKSPMTSQQMKPLGLGSGLNTRERLCYHVHMYLEAKQSAAAPACPSQLRTVPSTCGESLHRARSRNSAPVAAFGRFWPLLKDLLPVIRYDSANSGRFRRTYCAWPGKSPAKLSSGIGTFSARTASSRLHSRLTGAQGPSHDSCLPGYGSK